MSLLPPHFRVTMDRTTGLFVVTFVACLFVSTMARTGLNTVDAWGNFRGGNNWGNRNLGRNNNLRNNNWRNNNWRNNNFRGNNLWGNNGRNNRNWGRNGLRGRNRSDNVWDHLSMMLPGK